MYATEIKKMLESLFIIVINTYLMYISIYAHYIGSLLNAVAHDFCQFFGDVTIDVNGKAGFLNLRFCINCPTSQTKDFTLINDICTLPYLPVFLTLYVLLQSVEQK